MNITLQTPKMIHLASRKNRLFVLLLCTFFILLSVLYILDQDWSDPDWIRLLGALFHICFAGFMYWHSRSAQMQLYPDHLMYRLAGKRQKHIIPITPVTQISKDWKGIYFHHEDKVNKLPMYVDGDAYGLKVYEEVKAYYKLEEIQ